MTTQLRAAHPAREDSPWLAIAKFLLLAIFVIAVFMLGASMTHHRFFRGGWVNNHGVLKP